MRGHENQICYLVVMKKSSIGLCFIASASIEGVYEIFCTKRLIFKWLLSSKSPVNVGCVNLNYRILNMILSSSILDAINEVAIWLPLLVVLFTVENFFEALSAKIAGDSTAEDAGFLTLNPIPHIHVVNLIIFLLLLIPLMAFIGGRVPAMVFITLPVLMGARIRYSVPVDQYNFKRPVLGSIMYAISPFVAGLVIAFFSVAAFWFIVRCLPSLAATLQELLMRIASCAMYWAIIELIPLPPFHAGRALRYIVPQSWSGIADYLEEYALIIVIVLFFVPITSDIFRSSIAAISNSIVYGIIALFF